ncbi:MAG: DUF4129 domain-containing protein [Chloroflexi bacterium]|nr:DUF4129 domain-containing protein [Chloroflexota bacterium]MCI0580084.1 DUF4129 domain-containing protein [Chloroflexota bacterium]MCI0649340.1 DUF4129 domain-containing protein [Chloroflexota bacterium]MCI0726036.1 DUF4129 domain-containing protein [Chloroflexota bacterium]
MDSRSQWCGRRPPAGPGLLFALFLLGSLLQARQAPEPVPVESYWQLVTETQALVRELDEASPETRLERLAAVAGRWEQLSAVTLADGATVPIQSGFLVRLLRTDPPNLEALDELLATLLAARQAWPPPAHTAADLAALEQILARPEFQWQPEEQSWLARLLERFWTRVNQLLQRLLPDSVNGVPLSNFFFIALGSLALAAILFYALRGLLLDLVAEAESGPDEEEGGERLTAETAFKRAQALSSGGDYRTAVRYLYLSTLLLLEERGLLRYDRSKTNREYLRSLAHRPELAATLRDVIDVFDRVWYGFQPLDEAAYARYETRVGELRRQR